MPEPNLKRRRHACCSTLMDAAKASHPLCVERHLQDGSGRDELFRRSYARLPKPLHESAGAKPNRRSGYHMSTRNKPACTLCVEAMLAAGADSSWLDEGGRSPLQRAAMVGCVPCIEALLRSPNTMVNAVCDSGSSALLEAVRVKSVAAVRALLGSPASSASVAVLVASSSVTLLRPHEIEPLAPLNEAVKAGAYDCIEPLVEGGALVNPGPCTHEHRGGNCCDCVPPPLFVAAWGGYYARNENEETLRILRLLGRLGADVDARSTAHHGQTALHICSSNGRLGCMRVLLELGANPMALGDDRISALHLAASEGRAEACQLLIEHITKLLGVDKAAQALLAKDQHGKTPLHRATTAHYFDPSQRARTASCVSMLLRLLEASGGAQAVADALRDKAGSNDRTVVHEAAKLKQEDCLRVLTDTPEGRRVALEIADSDGFTPIALAQQEGHDFGDIPAFSNVPFKPCCGSISEATKKAHVTCVKHIVKDGDPAEMGEREAVASEGESAIDPLTAVPHGRHSLSRCSAILRVLLDAGFDPDGREGDGAPLLYATTDSTDCVPFGCEACTRLLIGAGASSFFFKTPANEYSAMSAILMEAGMEGPKSRTRWRELARIALAGCDLRDDKDGDTDFCRWAGDACNFDLARLLADAGVDCTAKCPYTGRTALHSAVRLVAMNDSESVEDRTQCDSSQHIELVEFTVTKGVAIDDTDNDGDTALHIAAREGYVDVLSKLLDLGANPLLVNAKKRATALHMAARAGHTAMVARLVDLGIDANMEDNNGATALHLASGVGKVDSVRILLEEGCDANAVTQDGFTPVRCAAGATDSSALAYFLDNGIGSQHEYHPAHGNLLHSAASRGSTAVLRLLVDKGWDPTSTVASTGETAVHLAARHGHPGAVTWLLGHGATLDVRDVYGMDPCAAAILRRPIDPSGYYSVRSVLEAVAESADGNSGLQAVFRGRSLIHLASSCGRSDCVKLLIANGAGADSKTVDPSEETAMHCATRSNHVGVVQALAEAGATIDAGDAFGTTSLHVAAITGHHATAVLLLDLGASCDATDQAGTTPLGAAARAGSVACCSLLVARGADMAHRDHQGRSALGAALESQQGQWTGLETVVKLLVGLGCPVTGAEVLAASRGALHGTFAEAITGRMDSGTSAHQLALATSQAAPTLLTVRLSRHRAPEFPSRHLPSSAAGANCSSKVYRIDGSRLQHAVSQLEGLEEAGKCLLLKLLLPPPEGWAASYRGVPAEGARRAAEQRGMPHPVGPTAEAGPQDLAEESAQSAVAGDGASPTSPHPITPLATEVRLSCNGDDFDEAGFEAVMEYVWTGQVVGATCGNVHEDCPSLDNTAVPEVAQRAHATHRAAAFFGLPRLQNKVRRWLEANGVEMEDDGTGVLSQTAVAT